MSDNMSDLIRASAAAAAERSELALRAYELLKTSGRLSSHRVLSYRCPQRCLLLDVLRTPDGFLLYFPRYRLSPVMNAETAESARVKRTEDGDRRWRARATYLDEFDVSVNCQHVRNAVLTAGQLDADLEAGAPEVTITT